MFVPTLLISLKSNLAPRLPHSKLEIPPRPEREYSKSKRNNLKSLPLRDSAKPNHPLHILDGQGLKSPNDSVNIPSIGPSIIRT